jgi:putative ubiquitin-RnfH superfamily antitoxin RatB of RatAB toxin-antitoxin module
MDIEVKVCKVPGALQVVMVREGATVQDALNAAGITVQSGELVKLEGLDTSMTSVVSNGSRVVVSKGAKGN